MSGAPPDLTEGFYLAWANACGRLGIDPFQLIRVAYSESGCYAHAHNKNGHASGLVQMMPDTLLGLGWTKGHEAFRQLTATEQVPYVERYYRPYAQWCVTDSLCYVATFLPALGPKAVEVGDAFVLCGMRGPLSWAYKANTVLDRDKDGNITVGDLGRQMEAVCRGARYTAIVERLRQAMGLEPLGLPEPEPTEPELPNLADLDDEPPESPTIHDSREIIEALVDMHRKKYGDDR